MLLLFGLYGAFPTPAWALKKVQGGGYVPEEGEYISDQGWSNDDWINVGTELITSGGTVTFQMGWCLSKYIVATFFAKEVKPLEFWLNFIQRWREDTNLRAPEDFRMMTGLMLDRRVDITWLSAKCADLSVQEGWDHIYPVPWAVKDERAATPVFDGGFSLMGMDERADAIPASNNNQGHRLANAIPASANISASNVKTIACEHIGLISKNSKNFEKMVNELAQEGYFEKDLGIPKGAKYLNLQYHGGVNGADGFFITAEGKCHLLEMKWYAQGGGRLGVIKVGEAKIVQTSPEWLHKALYRISKEDPERFAKLLAENSNTRFGKFVEMVDLVGKNKKEIMDICNLTEQEIENFADFEKLAAYIESKTDPDFMKDIGNYIGKDLHVGYITKVKGKVGHIDEVAESMEKWVARFGGEAEEIAEHVAEAAVK